MSSYCDIRVRYRRDRRKQRDRSLVRQVVIQQVLHGTRVHFLRIELLDSSPARPSLGIERVPGSERSLGEQTHVL